MRLAIAPAYLDGEIGFKEFHWGVVGAMLAGPLLVWAKAICERVPELTFIGELLSPDRTGDASA